MTDDLVEMQDGAGIAGHMQVRHERIAGIHHD